MRIAVLTSSRADYGIYRPLLQLLSRAEDVELELVVFGTHLSRFHGYTIDEIRKDGYEPFVCIDSMSMGDTPGAIASAMGNTMIQFSGYWAGASGRIDLAVCLGDRYEMFAAVSSSIPFNVPVAHIHGGETTLGAMDNIFRHSLSHMATLHFVATQAYANRLEELVGSSEHVFHVGALSLDSLAHFKPYSAAEFRQQFDLDVDDGTILVTLHPETKRPEDTERQVDVLAEVLENQQEWKALITMPNADTAGTVIRERMKKLNAEHPKRFQLAENLGQRGYFSAIALGAFLMGNSSSGIIEAASFDKYVINIGERQAGRISGKNVINVPFDAAALEAAMKRVAQNGSQRFENPYFVGGAAERILEGMRAFLKNDGS